MALIGKRIFATRVKDHVLAWVSYLVPFSIEGKDLTTILRIVITKQEWNVSSDRRDFGDRRVVVVILKAYRLIVLSHLTMTILMADRDFI